MTAERQRQLAVAARLRGGIALAEESVGLAVALSGAWGGATARVARYYPEPPNPAPGNVSALYPALVVVTATGEHFTLWNVHGDGVAREVYLA